MNKTVIFIYLFSLSITAKSQAVDFTFATGNGLFCNPSVVHFTPYFTGSPKGFVWTFGNGTGSNSQNPSISYNKAGSYTVKLIVIYQRTTSVATKTIVINPSITVSIGYDRNYICEPGDINFNAISNGNIQSYDWDFGDGSGIVSTATKNISHTYAALGTYNVTLLATDVSGCSNSNKTVIKVQAPTINGTRSPSSGCVPATVTLNANATIPVNSTVSNYTWNFGDGSPVASTTTKNINHVYAVPGNYVPTVMITTNEGCTGNYTFGGVGFGTPPTNEIAYPVKAVICGSDSVGLISKATKANTYRWDFGDGKTATVSDTLTHHKYATLGTKTITVVPAYNGCNGNPISFQVNVVGVIATYSYSNQCSDKKTFSFTNTSQGNLSTVSWNFGDGSPVVTTRNAVHTYPSSGSFVPTLTVTDSITGCSDNFTRGAIYTSDPAMINTDTSICKNTSITFAVVNTYNNPSATYTWYVAGKQAGPFKDSSFSVDANLFGNLNNYVIINNGAQYCPDTIRLNHTILVRGPQLSFTAPSSLCLNDSALLINSSKPYLPADSVNLWYWNYGINSTNDSVYQPAPFVYNNPGTYKVKLTGVDINGCKDTLVKTVVVHPLPFLYLIPQVDTLCAGNADTLFAFHSDSIKWSPPNSLTCATCDTVLTTALATTQYFITATSQFGCTTSDSILVKVYPPFTAVPSAADPYICLNDTIRLSVDPPGKKIQWSPADGLSGTDIYGPVARPAQTTTYTALLSDSVGCFTSSTNITVHVKSLPAVDAGPDQFLPYNSSFSINPTYSSNVASYNWDPGNLLSCTTCPDPNSVVTSSNTFFIKVTSDSGCVASDSIHIFIQCKDSYLLMPNAFTPNSDNLNDYFYPLTRGIKTILRFSIYDRYGHLVYEARNFPPNNKTYGWNGRVSGADQTTSVFVYYLEALCDVGEKLYKKGSVVLIR